MSGKEAVLQAMAGEKPDKTPVFISAYWDYWVRAADDDPFNWAYGGYQKQIDIEKKAALRHRGASIHRTRGCEKELTKSVATHDLPAAGSPPWTSLIEKYLPQLVVFDEAPEKQVEKEEDIAEVIRLDGRINNGENTEYIEHLTKEIGKDIFVAASGFGVFPHTRRCLGGVEKTMLSLMDNPRLVEKVMDALLSCYERSISLVARAGCDGVWHGAYNEGTDMISPKLWKRMIYPRHRRFVELCHKENLRAICWFLGDCTPLVELIADAGYDMLVLEQPRCGYDVNLGEIRKRVGNDLCLSGWLPELDIIQDNRDVLRKLIYGQYESAGQDGAFIFSTSMLDSSVNPETIDYICDLVDAMG
jgi:uroporphyrinogen-III decarboxylase